MMISYRLYGLDRDDRIINRVDYDADDDRAAIAVAAAEYPSDKWELWDLGRRVAVPSARQAA